MLFNYTTCKLLNELPFALEKDIQSLFERNLREITGLELVKSEFTIKNKRIDTLAFDTELNSFVIIEYKRSGCPGLIEQGLAYLGLMLENKTDFVNEYNNTVPSPFPPCRDAAGRGGLRLRRVEDSWRVGLPSPFPPGRASAGAGLTSGLSVLQKLAWQRANEEERIMLGKQFLLVCSDVNWHLSRIMFVSAEFTSNQLLSAGLDESAIELWEVKRYDNDIVSVNPAVYSPPA